MSTPESEHNFNGIIMLSYTAGEYSQLVNWADECFYRLERIKGFRRGSSGLLDGRSSDERPEWMGGDWEDPL